jgi:hypothetical protein
MKARAKRISIPFDSRHLNREEDRAFLERRARLAAGAAFQTATPNQDCTHASTALSK